MSNFLFLVVVAIIGGIAVTLQAQFLGVMDNSLGSLEGVFITYFSGGALMGLVMLVNRGGNLSNWQSVPWYAFFAGILGLIIIGSIGYTTSRMGITTAFTIMVATQFIGGMVIDHFGLLGAEVRQVEVSQLVGVGLLIAGIYLMIKK
jgi:transporter family-2 protein